MYEIPKMSELISDKSKYIARSSRCRTWNRLQEIKNRYRRNKSLSVFRCKQVQKITMTVSCV